ncbi:Mannose-1-phosphate guanyltransferase alpha [Porphyridium purpureum]|uniref:Mannose-1-phosphate guanyltransferase alpha n=1 Tax=Porphyridium purpureum TaxID=35688 RepID=A0A5J4Z1N1_PORPP|nr:Mannose-1-phosphate guanyltransferase alpha [Porphyridium purpureum]|eukprot:POR6009..scf295_1
MRAATSDPARKMGEPVSKKQKTGPVKAVILVGGASKGTRFRPLSMDCPKPLFPVAGFPMVEHHIQACATLDNMAEIILLGFYEEELFTPFIEGCTERYGIRIRYLREIVSLGSAGGLNRYRDDILAGDPSAVVILHCDIACSFPLAKMLAFHAAKSARVTVLGKELSLEEAHKYGEMAVNPESDEMIHYAAKPQSNISPVINCGVYVFHPDVFDKLQTVGGSRSSAMGSDQEEGIVRLEQDLLMPMAGQQFIYVYKMEEFWFQIKVPVHALIATKLYLEYFAKAKPELLSKNLAATRGTLARAASQSSFDVGTSAAKLDIQEPCLIHPSANIQPGARVGPNVTIAAGVMIGAGARLLDCIILEDVIIREHAFVKNSIIGWNSQIGAWTRVQGSETSPSIFSAGVTANAEVVVDSCVVLANKSISSSCRGEIIL